MDKKARAHHAENLMRDDVLQDAFNMVEKYYIDTIISGSASIDDVLEARQSILALKRVKSQIQTYIVDGKLLERKEQIVENTITIDQAADRLVAQPEAEAEAVDTTQDVEVETEETEEEVVTAEPEAEEVEAEAETTDEEDESAEVSASDETDEADDEESDGYETPQTVTVKVDGAEVDVTLEDLKRSYSGQGKIQKGMQEAAELRKQSEEMYQALQAEQQRFLQNVEAMQQQGLKAMPTPPDDAMLETDPIGYMQDKATYDKAVTEYQTQQAEIQNMQRQQNAMQQQAQEQYLQQQAQIVQDIVPELKNPEVAGKFKESLIKTGIESYGFTQDEMSSIMDARAVAVLSDAYRWRELQSSKAKAKKKPQAPRNVKPTSKRQTPQKVVRNKQLKAAKSSGRLEDFASLLLE